MDKGEREEVIVRKYRKFCGCSLWMVPNAEVKRVRVNGNYV